MNSAKYTVCYGEPDVFSEKLTYFFLTSNKGEGNFSCSVKVIVKV
jgi:hypothetical protein